MHNYLKTCPAGKSQIMKKKLNLSTFSFCTVLWYDQLTKCTVQLWYPDPSNNVCLFQKWLWMVRVPNRLLRQTFQYMYMYQKFMYSIPRRDKDIEISESTDLTETLKISGSHRYLVCSLYALLWLSYLQSKSVLNFLSEISADSGISDVTWLDSMQSDTTWGDWKYAVLMWALIWHG